MAPLDSALPTDDAYLSTSSAAPPPKPEPVEADASQYVEGWGARPELRGARGAPSVALGDNSLPPATEKMKLPAERYDHLEKENPQLHQMIDKAATDVGVPAIDLANIAYASSGFKSGTPGGYMNITPQDAKQLDPTGKFDPNDPVYNVYLGALKYKNLSDQYGVSTSSALGAYGADPDTIEAMGRLSPEDQRKHYPQVYDYLRRLSAGITGKQPGMTAVDAVDDQPPPPRPPEGRLGLELRSLRGEPGAPTNMAQVDAASAAQAARNQASPINEMQQAPTDMAQADAAGAAVARRRENLDLLGRVASRSNAPLPISEMQNPPTDLTQVDQARDVETGRRTAAEVAEMRRGGAPDAAGLEPVRPEFQPPGSQFADPLSGQRVAPLPEPTTTIPEMVRAGGRALADTARGATGVGSAIASLYASPTPLPVRYQQPPPAAGDPYGGRDRTDRGPVDADAGAALTAALPGAPAAPSAPTPPIPAPKPPVPPPTAALPGAPTPSGGGLDPATASTPVGAPAGAPATPPAAARPAPGADQSAARLNQDELARSPPGAPIPNVTTPSGAISQPVGQGGAGPAAPAVAAGTSAGEPPPIHGSGSVTLPGFFQATQQGGPQGGLSYGVANAPRGMSTNDMWAHLDSTLQRAFILKGDMVGVQRAREYVFQMQHAGSNQAMMQAYGALAVGDAVGAANLLAKAHAFVPDGSTMAFKVGPPDPRTGQPTLWGQRFVDATGQPAGGPMPITPQGIASMLNQTMDPQQFLKTLNTERTTMAKIAHNQNMEGLRNKAIDVGATTATANRQERAREADQGQAGATTRTLIADQRARELAAAADQRIRDIAAARKGEIANARRNALTKEADNYWNPTTNPQDFVGGDMGDGKPATPSQLSQAQDLHVGMRTATPDLQPKSAADFTKNILGGKWSVRPLTDGRLAVVDGVGNKGNIRAYLPGSMGQVFGRGPGEAAPPAAAAPAAQQAPTAPALVPPPPQQRAAAP